MSSEPLKPRAEAKPEKSVFGRRACFTTNGAKSTFIKPNAVRQEIPTPAPKRGAAGRGYAGRPTPLADVWQAADTS